LARTVLNGTLRPRKDQTEAPRRDLPACASNVVSQAADKARSRLAVVVRTAVLFARFGIKAAAELVFAQISSFTEPRSRLRACGNGSHFHRRCSFASPENVSIGRRVKVEPENRLWASPHAHLVIEDDVLLGPNVTIVTSNYGMSDRELAMSDQEWVESDVRIERRVWLGANVVVLPGVTIGEGAVIAASAVVTHSIPAFAIAGGVPAKVLEYR
jgi:acetyltransferase-like isoleucine patch superfamily enzyme